MMKSLLVVMGEGSKLRNLLLFRFLTTDNNHNNNNKKKTSLPFLSLHRPFVSDIILSSFLSLLLLLLPYSFWVDPWKLT